MGFNSGFKELMVLYVETHKVRRYVTLCYIYIYIYIYIERERERERERES